MSGREKKLIDIILLQRFIEKEEIYGRMLVIYAGVRKSIFYLYGCYIDFRKGFKEIQKKISQNCEEQKEGVYFQFCENNYRGGNIVVGM